MSNEELSDAAASIARSRAPLQDTIESLVVLRDTVDARIREIRDLDAKLGDLLEQARILLPGGFPRIDGTLTTAGVVSPSTQHVRHESPKSATESPQSEEDSNAFDTDGPVGGVSRGVSVREAILATLNSEDRPFTTAEIHERVVAYGATARNSMTTRSIISKLHNANMIRQVSRGVYQAPTDVSDVARETVQSRMWLLNDEPSVADPPVDRPGHDTAATATRPE